jgi:hypothetical protein
MDFHPKPIVKNDDTWAVMFLVDAPTQGTIGVYFSDLNFFRSHEHVLNIEVVTRLDTESGHLGKQSVHKQRVNVLSASAVTALCRQLAENYLNYNPNKIPYGLIIGQAIMALDRAVKAEPKTTKLMEIEPLGKRGDYLLGQFLADRAPNLLFGDAGGGKSYFCIRLALSVALGVPFLGFEPTKSLKVMYLDYEDDGTEFRTRGDELLSGITPPIVTDDIGLYYRHEVFPLTDIKNELRQEIREKGIGLLIVDSVGRACGSELERAEVANTYWNDLAYLGITTLTIAHVAKGSVSDKDGETNLKGQKTAFGSTFFGAGARNAWNYVFQEDGDDGIVRVCLYHRKTNRSRKSKPIPMEVDFRNLEAGGMVTLTMGSRDDWEEAQGCKDRIMGMFSEGFSSLQRGQIDDRLKPGFSEEAIKKCLHRLKRQNRLKQADDKGPYFLASP